jgi:hypothetical protein
MRSFSFFRRFPGGGPVIRAAQMVDRLGGRINPESDYDDDVCIYILGCYRHDGPEVEHAYYDVMDCGTPRLGRIRSRTKGDVIAVSKVQHEELQRIFGPRKVRFIPQHHCNFNRELRPERRISTVGCCGGDAAVQYPHDPIRRKLKEMRLGWQFGNEMMRRERVVEFYRTLDIQIVFRPTCNRYRNLLHMNPLKLVNAGSFGIPTVAWPEPAFVTEWDGCFIPAYSMSEVMDQVRRLRDDPGLYAEMSARALAKAEEYHLDNIVKLYEELAA